MRISITDRDNMILNFVEKRKSITIEQTRKIFFNHQKRGDVIARRRLAKLVSFGKLKVTKDKVTNQNVYYIDKPLRYHDLLGIDYYSQLIANGSQVVHFKQDKIWKFGNDTIKSDVFCCHSINNVVLFDIVEVNVTHAPRFEDYLKLVNSGEIQKLCDAIYRKVTGTNVPYPYKPRIVFIDNVKYRKERFAGINIPVIHLDADLNEFVRIYLQKAN